MTNDFIKNFIKEFISADTARNFGAPKRKLWKTFLAPKPFENIQDTQFLDPYTGLYANQLKEIHNQILKSLTKGPQKQRITIKLTGGFNRKETSFLQYMGYLVTGDPLSEKKLINVVWAPQMELLYPYPIITSEKNGTRKMIENEKQEPDRISWKQFKMNKELEILNSMRIDD